MLGSGNFTDNVFMHDTVMTLLADEQDDIPVDAPKTNGAAQHLHD